MIKRFFFDLETTGVDYNKNAIHQIAMILDIDGVIVERLDWRMKPFKGAVVEPEALAVGGVTLEQVMAYPEATAVYKDLLKVLGKYADKFNKRDKFHLCGFNNRYFDDRFLRAWFEREGDQYFGSWFWADSLDVMVLASQALLDQRHNMINFKLSTVAETVGLTVKEESLHDGLYDVELTRQAYYLITML